MYWYVEIVLVVMICREVIEWESCVVYYSGIDWLGFVDEVWMDGWDFGVIGIYVSIDVLLCGW